MLPRIQENLEAVAGVCERFGVRRLEVFGSAAEGEFDEARSDLDFLVEFAALTPEEHADAFFGLQEALEDLLGAPVDLVERAPIRNPYFLQSVDQTKALVYAVA